jgi:hypothetical protein
MTFTITYTRTYTTDDADPIVSQSDDAVAEWFAGSPLHQLAIAEGFGFELKREGE